MIFPCVKYITFTLHLHYIYITFTLHLHYIYTKFTLHLHYIYTTFTLHSHYIQTTFTLHSNYIHTTFTLHSHYIHTTFTLFTLHLHYIYILTERAVVLSNAIFFIDDYSYILNFRNPDNFPAILNIYRLNVKSKNQSCKCTFCEITSHCTKLSRSHLSG